MDPAQMQVAVVIPCYRVRAQILEVLAGIGPECQAIYVVDDACPERSGDLVEAEAADPRVHVLRHGTNQGVGGATLTGYAAALAGGAGVIVKLDGDGQMDPRRIPQLLGPILAGEADYVKGNRFFDLDALRPMPTIRLIGNSLLSFATKFSTGYWDLFDPTNGFTAIHGRVLEQLPLQKVSRGWFFESDLLFRLNTLRAVVRDVPMPARYGSERSNLRISSVLVEFTWKHAANTFKRIVYNYFLRNFSIASVELVLGSLSLALGMSVGVTRWIEVIRTRQLASAGTVMLAALPVLIGVQMLLAFLSYDMQNVPRDPLHTRLRCFDAPRD